MKLGDLYNNAELTDESEALFHCLCAEVEGFDFTSKLLAWEDIVLLEPWGGGVKLIASMDALATPEQIELINEKAHSFDAGRCVVLEGVRVVDGHHHLVAAYKIQEDVSYIDLEDAYPEAEAGPDF